MVQLGWKAGPEQYPPTELLEYAVAAEAAGFETIDVSDHFHPWSDEGQAAFVWTWLGAAAVQTKTTVLGTGVTCPILRYHPAIIAQAVATLECMAPGRVYLGVGTGEALNEYAAVGEWPGYAERQERLAEALALIRELWTGNEVTFQGKYYETRKARLYTRSDRPIPIYISALVPNSARFAAQFGDGLFTVGGQKPELYRELLTSFDTAARAAGKDPSTMPKLIELNVAYTDDDEAALESMHRYWAGTFIPALFDQKIYTPAMSAQNGEAVGNDIMRQKMCLSGTVEDHVAYGKQHIDLGFTTLFYHCAGPDQRGFLEAYGRDVLPELRTGTGS